MSNEGALPDPPDRLPPMYIIHKIEVGRVPLEPGIVLAEARTLREIRDRALALYNAGTDWAQMYLFNETSDELGLSAEWLEAWIDGKRTWPAE